MSDVKLTKLADIWTKGTDAPLTLHEIDDPVSQTGSHAIRPRERVLEEGWTSHEGDEISIILDGEVELVTPGGKYSVSPGMVSVVPAGVKHYSVNDTDKPVRLVCTVVGGLWGHHVTLVRDRFVPGLVCFRHRHRLVLRHKVMALQLRARIALDVSKRRVPDA